MLQSSPQVSTGLYACSVDTPSTSRNRISVFYHFASWAARFANCAQEFVNSFSSAADMFFFFVVVCLFICLFVSVPRVFLWYFRLIWTQNRVLYQVLPTEEKHKSWIRVELIEPNLGMEKVKQFSWKTQTS